MQLAPQARRAKFGVFEVDLVTGELFKAGLRLRLQEQSFRVLAMLLERPGELVSREEMVQQLWPPDTFVDFDHGLNTAVAKLRDVLGDPAVNPRFIETLAKRGYRFIAAVQMTGGESLETTVSRAPAPVVQFPGGGEAPAPVLSSAAAAGDGPAYTTQESVVRVHGLELPRAPRGLLRGLFALIQVMYLVFYLLALARFNAVYDLAQLPAGRFIGAFVTLLVVTALLGVATRLFLLAAVLFDYRYLGRNFLRIFPLVVALDELWALAPLLIANTIGLGLALAATAALLYLPFSQRTLVRMAYWETLIPAK